jgi:hypothetical protein
MTSPARNLLGGAVVAAALASLALLVTSGGAIGWKVALALVGLALWVAGGVARD